MPEVDTSEPSHARLSGVLGEASRRARRAPRGRVAQLALGSLLLMLLGGCVGEDSRQDAGASAIADSPTSVAVTTPVTTPSAPAELGAVVWAERIDPTTGEPQATVDAFPAETETIYALAPVRSAPAGSVVAATWALNGTPIEGSSQQVRITEAVDGGWVAFQLTWTGEGVWPPGTLSVSLTANGRPAGEGSVAVAS